jgi:uncharacterized membrane protein
MKTRRAFLAISVTALILAVLLISLKAYYVVISLVVGLLVIGHREIWSLLKTRKLPPVDERVRQSSGRALRNSFIFFAIATAFLMLAFTVNQTANPDVVNVLGGLFLSAGVVYILSYFYYDRAEPKLGERGLKMMKNFLLLAGISLGTFIISVFLHNFISGLLGVEEPVFFIIAVIISPLALAVGLIGSLVLFIKGLVSKPG